MVRSRPVCSICRCPLLIRPGQLKHYDEDDDDDDDIDDDDDDDALMIY